MTTDTQTAIAWEAEKLLPLSHTSRMAALRVLFDAYVSEHNTEPTAQQLVDLFRARNAR